MNILNSTKNPFFSTLSYSRTLSLKLILLSTFGVFADILTTRLGLFLGYKEANILGNNLFLELLIVYFWVLLYLSVSRFISKTQKINIKKKNIMLKVTISYAIILSLVPFVMALRNAMIIILGV